MAHTNEYKWNWEKLNMISGCVNVSAFWELWFCKMSPWKKTGQNVQGSPHIISYKCKGVCITQWNFN